MKHEICPLGLAIWRSLVVVVVREAKAWVGQVHEKMEGEILEIVSIQTSSKVICHKGGREMET